VKKIVRFNFLLALALLLMSGGGVNPAEVFAHYAAAVKNKSGMQYFAVIKVVDVSRNTMYEVCAPGSAIRSALHKELKYDYDDQSVAMVQHVALMSLDRILEFKDTTAIELLGGNAYTETELMAFEKTKDIKTLAKNIRSWGTWQMEFRDDREMLMYAHALFNQGILTGEDNQRLGTLVYVK
jgi:ribosomal protein L11